jgi:hypothetical protein
MDRALFREGQMVRLHDVRRSRAEGDPTWTLSWQPTSVGIVIPGDDAIDFGGVKDICAGMGGIT